MVNRDSLPGVFKVVCLATERAFYGESENPSSIVDYIYDSLRARVCEHPQILADYREYGYEDFRIAVVNVDPEMQDPEVHKAKVEELKRQWGASLYDDLEENPNWFLPDWW